MIQRVYSGEAFGYREKLANGSLGPSMIGTAQTNLLNELVAAFNAFGSMRGDGRIEIAKSSVGPHVRAIERPVRFWQITGGGTGGIYSAKEVLKVPGQFFVPIGGATTSSLAEANAIATLPVGYVAEAILSRTSTEWLFQSVRNPGACGGVLNFSFFGCPAYTYTSPPSNSSAAQCSNATAGSGLQSGVAYTVVNSSGTTVCSGTTTNTLNSYGTQVSCTGLAAGTYTVTGSLARYAAFSASVTVGCLTQKMFFQLTPATGYLCCVSPSSAPCTAPIASTLSLTDPDGVVVTMYGSDVNGFDYGGTPASTGCGTVWYGCRTKSMSGFSVQYGVCTAATVTVAIQYILSCSYAQGWTLAENWTICCAADPCDGSFNPCSWPGAGVCGSNGQIAAGTVAPAFGPVATAAYSPASCLPLSLTFSLPACGYDPTYSGYGNLIAGTATVTE